MHRLVARAGVIPFHFILPHTRSRAILSLRAPSSLANTSRFVHPRLLSTQSSEEPDPNQKRNTENNNKEDVKAKNRSIGMWSFAAVIAALGLAYAAVPIYRLFCRATGYGGTVRTESSVGDDGSVSLSRGGGGDKGPRTAPLRPLTINFNADLSDHLPWRFKPMQHTLQIIPGEPALAFYQATNKSETAITGVATYNITPQKAGNYFVKVQCFCFDEQRLGPHESLPMPVLFYVDPAILDDPNLKDVNQLTLSYMFFRSEVQE
eukprot:TRINITY_DN3200_c0_g1_i4.p1 TRINITY_DN3200_c0_g1~~TRINITY_DN3200_c0_g1_i4.p1  ORF type:complete len:263 (-),score=46.13 TRINITY_DN3200_c0_g1_i4:87-875(-)